MTRIPFLCSLLAALFLAPDQNFCRALVPLTPTTATESLSHPSSSSALGYRYTEHDDEDVQSMPRAETLATAAQAEIAVLEPPTTTIPNTVIEKPQKKKPSITSLWSLDDFVNFVDDDDRLAVVKFYAPWCKTCQKLGRNFDRLASVIGDGIVDRKKVKGTVRFAQVEYGPRTKALIESLQIDATPAMQLYSSGQNKLWDLSGMKSTKELEQQLKEFQNMDAEELLARAEELDDGVLKAAIEEDFYAAPSFLDEEW